MFSCGRIKTCIHTQKKYSYSYDSAMYDCTMYITKVTAAKGAICTSQERCVPMYFHHALNVLVRTWIFKMLPYVESLNVKSIVYILNDRLWISARDKQYLGFAVII